jgi:hypothetical protein
MTDFEWWTVIIGGAGFLTSQTISVLTFVQSRRSATQAFVNGTHLQDVRVMVNGQTASLIETSKALAQAQGNKEGRAEATVERADAAKIVLDDAESRSPHGPLQPGPQPESTIL